MVNYKVKVNIITEVSEDIVSNILSNEIKPVLIDYEKMLENNVKAIVSLDTNLLTISLQHELRRPLVKQYYIESISDLLKVYVLYYYDDKYFIKLNVDNFFIEHSYFIEKSTHLYDISHNEVYDFITYADFNDKTELLDSCYLFLMNCHKMSNTTKKYMADKMNYYGYTNEDIIDECIDYETETNPDMYFNVFISNCLDELYNNSLSNEDNPMDLHNCIKTMYDKYRDLVNEGER